MTVKYLLPPVSPFPDAAFPESHERQCGRGSAAGRIDPFGCQGDLR